MAALSDNYFKDVCQSLGFLVVGIDADMRITFWNQQAADHFGGITNDPVGVPFLDLFHESQRDAVREVVAAALNERTVGDLEVKFFEEDGGKRTFVLIASPVIDAQGNSLGASASMRDISNRKKLSQELARSRRMASLGSMAGGVAHHFNNILGGMLTSIDYVLPSDSPRELRRTLRLLAQAIGRATRITKQLAAFAESENEVIDWDELNAIVDGFITRIRPIAEKANVQLTTDIESVDSGPFESQRLLPILESLSHNAFDAMPSGGNLTVSMKKEGRTAVITVTDTGCGIAEDLLDRVFEPFFTTKGELGGGDLENIGLGLAAVHGLVSEMGGKIEMASKVGQGTVVTIRLPLDRMIGDSGQPPGTQPSA